MNPQFLWCTLDARDDANDLVKQLQAYAAIKSFGEMAHQPFGIVLEVSVQPLRSAQEVQTRIQASVQCPCQL